MRKLIGPILVTLLIMMLVALVGGTSVAEEAAVSAGQDAFMTLKCNSCHAVPSVSIEAKIKSAAMKGPALPTAQSNDADRDLMLQYVRKEVEFDGKKHKKGSKATDDELNVVLDWLKEQPVPEPE